MREFIITNPNLSVGRPGDIVTADQLRMTDDKLDDFVAAGHALSLIHISEPTRLGMLSRMPSSA